MSDDPRPAPPSVEEDLVSEIERMAETLGARRDHADLARRLEWIVDVLIQRGHLAPGHRRIIERLRGNGSNVKLALFRDKRAVPGPEPPIDCAGRLPVCRAACCRFTVTLSLEDLDERRLRFRVHEPYLLPKSATTGYCLYCAEGGGCTVYDDRPGACRAYDCRHDERIWADFEGRVLAAELREELARAGTPPDQAR